VPNYGINNVIRCRWMAEPSPAAPSRAEPSRAELSRAAPQKHQNPYRFSDFNTLWDGVVLGPRSHRSIYNSHLGNFLEKNVKMNFRFSLSKTVILHFFRPHKMRKTFCAVICHSQNNNFAVFLLNAKSLFFAIEICDMAFFSAARNARNILRCYMPFSK